MFVLCPLLCWAIADITRKNTNTGAITFNAPTNKDPNRSIGFTASGTVIANIIPMNKPIMICFTKPN